MSHQTYYRSYQGWVFTSQMTQPALKEDMALQIRLQSHQVYPHHVTIIQHIRQYEKKTQNTQT